jgi:hypothetical protein
MGKNRGGAVAVNLLFTVLNAKEHGWGVRFKRQYSHAASLLINKNTCGLRDIRLIRVKRVVKVVRVIRLLELLWFLGLLEL